MRRRGFTVIELLAGVGLVAIVAAMSALAGSSVATAIHAAASGRTLAQTMRETRARAMAEGAPIDVLFDASTSTWAVRPVGGPVRRTEPLPAPIRFLALPARARIRFDSNGTAENGTIALGAGSAACRIVVNQRGRVRLG
jgi:prepilin-type N-terminal cleavage/methylation domain-containing protein